MTDSVDQTIKLLVEEGRPKGFLTYAEMSKLMEDQFLPPDKMDQVFIGLEDAGIDVVDDNDTEVSGDVTAKTATDAKASVAAVAAKALQDAGKVTVAETVLRNIRVLALDQATAAEKDAKSIVAATATLEVGPAEAETLARAKAGGAISLALRAYTDMGGPSGVTHVVARDDSTVRINRGGQTSSVAVRP